MRGADRLLAAAGLVWSALLLLAGFWLLAEFLRDPLAGYGTAGILGLVALVCLLSGLLTSALSLRLWSARSGRPAAPHTSIPDPHP
ncbi:hypothetical protein E5163_02530 [Marinicauda algicola]|uniref:Uncharacterized protein n=1 Tax=Marinicauda algicola TaxID=2029849 RepID=A0A4S2H388_9PROT|nr:hypothetical protein [Marinicauda algicola]TGY90026.1 hypothetical protein E5163_02530 [Marinicauda algicola]